MQTLGLMTTTIAATDAGAESAAQTIAAAGSVSGTSAGATPSTPANDLFDSLMASVAQLTTDDMVNGAQPITSVPDATQDATQIFAADMERMVQALAITADVVANGMAARTTAVPEIILTVETPVASADTENALPDISASLPLHLQGPDLTISEPDPVKNIDPALALFLPLPVKAEGTQDTHDQITLQTSQGPAQVLPAHFLAPVSDIQDQLAPQQLLAPIEEAHGPWRVEIYGPILGPDRQIITTPVHLAASEAPVELTPVSGAPTTAPVEAELRHDIQSAPAILPVVDHDQDKQVAAEMIRVLTVPVPVHKANRDTTSDAPVSMDDETVLTHVLSDDAPTTPAHPPIATTQIDILLPQMMVIAADPRLDQPPRADQAVADASTDVLEAPHRIWRDTPVVLSMAKPLMGEPPITQPIIQPKASPHLVAEKIVAEELIDMTMPLPKDGLPAQQPKMAQRHAFASMDIATNHETNIASSVANSSSRSHGNIRDLVKLGVRDIEITHGTGTQQAGNVSPQVQMLSPDSAPSAARAQMADPFAPSGNEFNNAERRAQAHDMRMRAIERQVIAAVRDGADTIRMQLYPPGLGQIIIRLTMDGSKLKMTTKASSLEAADSLRSIESDLRDALSSSGLELAGFDVSDEGKREDKRTAQPDKTDETKDNPRSAKLENFALDMNA